MATILRRNCSGFTPVMLVALLVAPPMAAAQAAPPAAGAPSAPATTERTTERATERNTERAAAPTSRPPPRLLSPEEKRLSAVEPGQLRPAQRPVPQVRIPIGPRGEADRQRPERPEGIRPLRRAPAAAASATGRIDDEAARCEAQASDEAARACRLLVGKGRAPRREVGIDQALSPTRP